MKQYEYELIPFRAPSYRTEMYSKFVYGYGSQFSGEKRFENPILGCRDINQNRWLILL